MRVEELSLGTTKAVEWLETSSDAIENEETLASWAPFLLVHRRGQDNITTFTSEDNESWLGHLFYLVFQCLAVVYTFVQWTLLLFLYFHLIRKILLSLQFQDKMIKKSILYMKFH